MSFRCECKDEDFQTANSECELCKGTGQIEGLSLEEEKTLLVSELIEDKDYIVRSYESNFINTYRVSGGRIYCTFSGGDFGSAQTFWFIPEVINDVEYLKNVDVPNMYVNDLELVVTEIYNIVMLLDMPSQYGGKMGVIE
ncbi:MULTISPECIES: hypothetical protein [unclassified Paenibacillus]|uniref:hypothetical protein n=1 Tax=unclassified Paenibacillus TaxID=185978 RepID=UPI002787DD1E|nr:MULTISPECIES: hypothetical protein [unclassified Paenibacillus]MDQ0896348.1 hypothetical protein [Paenibacillus sp. V4I7]MDQ0914109.1 hypothetical protein [Paenibacillus sp. V4I5]